MVQSTKTVLAGVVAPTIAIAAEGLYATHPLPLPFSTPLNWLISKLRPASHSFGRFQLVPPVSFVNAGAPLL
jgi:hypothetical protein